MLTDAAPTNGLNGPESFTFPLRLQRAVDLLFVIDNSSGMAQQQANLMYNTFRLVEAMKSPRLAGKIPDVHVGVITSDLGAGDYGLVGCETLGGDRGVLQTRVLIPACASATDAWVSYAEGVTNIRDCAETDPLLCVVEAVECLLARGITGCGFEMPLEATRRALDPELNLNPGFLRHDALLAVVFLTDEDDCSAADTMLFDPQSQGLSDPLGPLTSFRCFEFGVQCDINDRTVEGPRHDCVPAYDWLFRVEDYVRFLEQLKGRQRMVVAAIAGPKEPVSMLLYPPDKKLHAVLSPSCVTSNGSALPAIRLGHVVEALGGQVFPICADDYGPYLQTVGEQILSKLAGRCLPKPVLAENGGLACAAGVAPCRMPTCPEGTQCDITDGVCLDPYGNETPHYCGASCLDKVRCDVSVPHAHGTPAGQETTISRCPRELFDPAILQDACGSHCPCWRIVQDSQTCHPSASITPLAFEIMRPRATTLPGEEVVVRCATASFSWTDGAFQNAPRHCAPPEE